MNEFDRLGLSKENTEKIKEAVTLINTLSPNPIDGPVTAQQILSIFGGVPTPNEIYEKLLGKVATTGTGPYTHTIKAG